MKDIQGLKKVWSPLQNFLISMKLLTRMSIATDFSVI